MRNYAVTKPVPHGATSAAAAIDYIQNITRHEIDRDGALVLYRGDEEAGRYARGEWGGVGYA